jgi:high affinity Mn2+ porin
VGAGGFPNGEAQKSNFPYPHYNTSRLYLRQTFGFGGEQEELASGPTQLGGKVDVSRLTLQAGKFAVLDIFDGNAYAKDTRRISSTGRSQRRGVRLLSPTRSA